MKAPRAKKLLESLDQKTNDRDAFLKLIEDKAFLDIFEDNQEAVDSLSEKMNAFFQSIEIPKNLKKDILDTIKRQDTSDKSSQS